MVAVRTRPNQNSRPKPSRGRDAEQSVDADIRELTSLMYAVMNRFQVIRKTLAASLKLTPPEFAVVMSLHRLPPGEGVRIRDLAENIHSAAANVTSRVKTLERKRWVAKAPDVFDSRALSVQLTKEARERLNRFFETMHPVNEAWFQGVSKADMSTVKTFLSLLIAQYPRALHEARSLRLQP